MALDPAPVTLESLAAMLTERLGAMEQRIEELTQENADLRASAATVATAPREQDESEQGTPLERLSRRWVLRRGVQAASAAAVIAALGQRQSAQAAPATDAWLLGGNTNVSTDGSNYLGTNNVAPLIFKVTKTTGTAPIERMRINTSGFVGVGTTAPVGLLHARVNGPVPAVMGDNVSLVANTTGIQGRLTSTSPGAGSAAVRGVSNGTQYTGDGVLGTHAGPGYGVHGTSVHGYGVVGESPNGYGVKGDGGWTGLYGTGGGFGVQAYASRAGSTGVHASGITYGVTAYATDLDGFAGYFYNYAGNASNTSGAGVQGLGSGGSDSLIHPGGNYWDAGGEFSGLNGLIGAAAGSNGYGVIGIAGPGSGGYGLYSHGNAYVLGTFASYGTKNFEIDHPLDPANKILRHAAIESSEVLNVYSGTVSLVADGTATVTLPDWMEALNRDFRYQLTPVGAYAPVYIATKLTNNQFTIAGGTAGMEVCWQVTAIRNDKYMQQHPLEVESDKQGDDRGKFRDPELHGQPKDKGMGQQSHKRKERKAPAAPTPPVTTPQGD